MPITSRKEFLILSILFILIIVHGVFTQIPGQSWSDDFALYVMHANNIAHGIPYSNTSYIYNPDAFTYSPASYPPGFPVLLAPFVGIWGIDLQVLQFVVLGSFIIALLFMYLWLRLRINSFAAILCVAFIGFSSGVWVLRDYIIADFPALAVLLATVWYFEKKEHFNHIKIALIGGLLLFLNYAFRPVDFILFPAVLIYAYRFKKINFKYALLLSAITILPIILQRMLLPIDSNYLEMVAGGYSGVPLLQSVKDIFYRVYENCGSLVYLINTGDDVSFSNVWILLSFLISGIGLILFGYGILRARKFHIYEIFAILYLLVVFTFPGFQILRYILPVVPLYLYYLAEGISAIKITQIRTGLVVGLGMLLSVIFIRFYVIKTASYHQNRTDTATAIGLFNFINDNIPATDLIMCQRARTVALFTEKMAIPYPDGHDVEDIKKNIEIYPIQYIIQHTADYNRGIATYIENEINTLELIYQNNDFKVYRTLH